MNRFPLPAVFNGFPGFTLLVPVNYILNRMYQTVAKWSFVLLLADMFFLVPTSLHSAQPFKTKYHIIVDKLLVIMTC